MKTKKCSKCALVLSVEEFYLNRKATLKRGGSDRYSHCKKCHNGYSVAWQQAHLERVRELSRLRDEANPEKAREKRRRLYREDPKRAYEWQKKYRSKDGGIKTRAQSKVAAAKQRGILKPAPCEVCGEVKVHAHHDDYSKPLEIKWLCVKHHKLLHRKAA